MYIYSFIQCAAVRNGTIEGLFSYERPCQIRLTSPSGKQTAVFNPRVEMHGSAISLVRISIWGKFYTTYLAEKYTRV